jgi:hypothetical protein
MIKDYDFFDENGKLFLSKIEFSDCIMTFPHGVSQALEMEDKILVRFAFSKNEVAENEKLQNIWCYHKPEPGKTEGKLLWKIEPPVNHRGESYDYPYYSLKWSTLKNAIYVANDAFGYTVDPDTGHITLVASGLR